MQVVIRNVKIDTRSAFSTFCKYLVLISFCSSASREQQPPRISAPPEVVKQRTWSRRTGANAPVPHLLMPRPLEIDTDLKEPSSAPSSPTKSQKSPLRRLRSLPSRQAKANKESNKIPRLRLPGNLKYCRYVCKEQFSVTVGCLNIHFQQLFIFHKRIINTRTITKHSHIP